MPRGDGTGPAGAGPKTGRGRGYCAGYDMPGYMNRRFGYGGMGVGLGFGRGMGFGRGWGRGMACWNCPFCGWFGPKDEKEAKKYYKEYIKEIEEELEEAKKALSNLDKSE